MKKDKILLINPLHLWPWTWPALGLAYLASNLEKKGVKVRIIDCQINKNYEHDIIESFKDYKIVGISLNVGTISSGLNIAKLIKRIAPDIKIIMGGPEATAIYNKLIPKYADVVVIGEGEDTIVELMQTDDLSTIRGIAYWNKGINITQHRPLITDLDRLSYPAWHLFNLKKYRFGTIRNPYVGLMTSRGCPYQCVYCTKFIHGTNIRLRSIKNVIAEIDYVVKKYSVREIEIYDDIFTFYPERVKEFCKTILGREYKNLRFSLPGGIRADMGDSEMFNYLAKAGFYFVLIGIDSGSQEIQNKLGKNLDLRKVKQTVELVKRAGMRAHGSFIIGLPYDTVDTMQETINFAKSLPLDQAYFFIGTPFPGTAFYDIVQKNGKFLYDLTTNSTCYVTGKALFEMENLKSEDIEKMFRKAYREFYFRPSQLWRMLNTKITSESFLGLVRSGYTIFIRGGKF